MSDKIDKIYSGVLGVFWSRQEDLEAGGDAKYGHVAVAGRRAKLSLIDTDDAFSTQGSADGFPDVISGFTEVGGISLLDIRRRHNESKFGSSLVSTESFESDSFVVGIDVPSVPTGQVLELRIFFLGIVTWLGFRSGYLTKDPSDTGDTSGMTYTVRSMPEVSCSYAKKGKISISTSWSARERQMDQFSAEMPFVLSVNHGRFVNWNVAADKVRAFQDLICLAFDCFVPVDKSEAFMGTVEASTAGYSSLWSGQLMVPPAGVKVLSEKTERPSFTYSSIGSVEGVRRWLELAEKHPRAVGPLVSKYRSGGNVLEMELMNVAVSIDYWVASCARAKPKPKWVGLRGGKGNPAIALAANVGRTFEEFVGGDSRKWGKLFWDRYGALKHDPSIEYDAEEIYYLSRTGRVLMMCALLNRISRSKNPTVDLCQCHRYYDDGIAMRKILERPVRYYRKR